jgi:hypothetical protein
MRMQIWQESQTGHKAEVIEQEQSQGEEEIAERRPYVTLNAQRFFREAMAYKTVVLPPCSSPTATPASPLTLECGNEAAKERSPASSTPPSLVTGSLHARCDLSPTAATSGLRPIHSVWIRRAVLARVPARFGEKAHFARPFLVPAHVNVARTG